MTDIQSGLQIKSVRALRLHIILYIRLTNVGNAVALVFGSTKDHNNLTLVNSK